MNEFQLPPVAKSIFYFCKKCDVERYHKVIAHVSAISAKIECEVCHAKKTYKVTEPKTGRKMVAKKGVEKKKSPGSHRQTYEELFAKVGKANAQPYNIKLQFKKDVAIDHPKFGLGFVVQALNDRIEVCFEDSARTLVHNRTI